MNRKNTRQYKERLIALRSELRGDVNQMTGAVLEKNLQQANGDISSMPSHMADIGTDNFDREFTLSLMANKGQILEQIEKALERIEEGNYGVCENCNRIISVPRLNAIPYAILCIECAAQFESTGEAGYVQKTF